ncbi:Uncharacterised protein [Candidatus Bartonella washoeensis]|uniref:Uncharacterized protein n=3 Tax=Candidatus Bartonella washoeensis TaxID=186739 RepID=J0Q1F9_9HYPH|nr:hypothetical protein MCQ_01215 [Bartonella washoeensis Sb944nv]SPU27319.1 Uncharacterised protein [Bartonella washoeensis]
MPFTLKQKLNAHATSSEFFADPSHMFAVEFANGSNQNVWLDNMQITMFEPKGNEEKRFFFSPYGNRSMLSSSTHLPQDGIGADIRSAALPKGLTLKALEDQNISTNFDLLGVYAN